MQTEFQQQSDQFVHSLSNPGAVGLCQEMLEVAAHACRTGNFELAAEIYGSQLADLTQPDRGLCLRRADALARSGRISEALESYITAANIRTLRSEELGCLVENIVRTLREKELNVSDSGLAHQKDEFGSSTAKEPDRESRAYDQLTDPFSCRLCKRLLSDPSTLQCGHTFCKHCLEEDTVTECVFCKYKLNKVDGKPQPYGFRVNVVLSGCLDKLFESKSKGVRLWIEGEHQRKKQNFADALEKYNKAVELAPSDCDLLLQRSELLLMMGKCNQALMDTETATRQQPLWPEGHYAKAAALVKAGRQEEALQEYFLCLALKPDWTEVKVEAQKLLSEVFSSVFERDGLALSLSPPQTEPLQYFKPAALLSSLHTQVTHNGRSAKHSLSLSLSLSQSCDQRKRSVNAAISDEYSSPEGTKTLGSVASCLSTPSGLKRKHSTDTPSNEPPTKLLRTDSACSSHTAVAGFRGRLDSTDMECSLCMRLFYEPVTTPCGHTFCLKCLERCLDHNPKCPLCKQNLSEYLATRGYSKNVVMEEVLQHFLGEELADRKKIHEEEMRELGNLNQEVPIFICTMAFPTIPCPLHVFEPQYRLMIRRCMETGTKQFGMCIADNLKGFADYGCMLEVRDVKFFPDGRSVADTIGVSRFRVLSHGQRDGYHTAKIEYLEDKEVVGEELTDLQRLHDSVYEQAKDWFSSLKDNMKNQILSHFGQLPGKNADPQASSNGPAWCWWLLAVLPLESRAQLTILAMSSLRERLVAIRRVLLFVSRRRPK
ncbi:LON peptidase N-terminal domain and RING finger protein 2 [Chanos chanos]|uniref:LON peptidase N-terminal domain and RING finger protein 2 n=1 Tax=Chanos chanos TaxID=29144 RepID=A0A6J2WD81_CHACN|nr:LON peptidase N-terminal domain and RING finger protein 2-like [Chanos chanos]